MLVRASACRCLPAFIPHACCLLPLGLPAAGDGVLPGAVAAGYRPAVRAHVPRAAGAASHSQQQQQQQQQQQRNQPPHQARLTPRVTHGSKQQAAVAGGLPAAGHPGAAPEAQASRGASAEPPAAGSWQQAEEGNKWEDQELAWGAAVTPLGEAAEPSQQLGLSPGGTGGQVPGEPPPPAQPAAGAGSAAGEAGEGAAVAPAAAAPSALPTAASAAAPPPRSYQSGPAREWGGLLAAALQLFAEMNAADPQGQRSHDPYPPGCAAEEQEEVYEQTVGGWVGGLPHEPHLGVLCVGPCGRAMVGRAGGSRMASTVRLVCSARSACSLRGAARLYPDPLTVATLLPLPFTMMQYAANTAALGQILSKANGMLTEHLVASRQDEGGRPCCGHSNVDALLVGSAAPKPACLSGSSGVRP